MRGSARSGRSPQPSPADEREAEARARAAATPRQAREVLARLDRAHAEHVAPPSSSRSPVGREPGAETRVRDDDAAPARPAGSSRRRAPVKAEFAKSDVARAHRVRAPCRVHRDRARRAPLRMVERDEVVEDGRAEAASLRWEHPVGEDEGVDRPPDDALEREPPAPAPGRPEGVRGGQRNEPRLHVDARERLPDPRGAAAGSSARTRRTSWPARVRGRDEALQASRGCSSRSPCADARAARRRRRSSWPRRVGEHVEVDAEHAIVARGRIDLGRDRGRRDT